MKRFLQPLALLLALALTQPAHAQAINEAIQGPWTTRCDAAQTVTAAAYSAGNAVGGLITCANAIRVGGHGAILQSVVLRDKSGNNTTYTLWLFDSAPTAPTDRSAYAIGTDLARTIGAIALTGTLNAGTPGLINLDGIAKSLKLGSGTTLYGVLVTTGTPIFAGTADVSLTLTFLPD